MSINREHPLKMISKFILFISPVLVIIIMFERIKNNNVLEYHFHYQVNVKNGDAVRMLQFLDYVRRFNKTYDKVEFKSRFRYFKKNLKSIRRMNKSPQLATFGLTKFTDWSKQELAQMLSPQSLQNCDSRVKIHCGHSNVFEQRDNGEILPKKDWRAENMIGPILNQKMCSACWAFSLAGLMESMAAIQGYGFTRLSIQELISCTYGGSDKTGCQKGRPIIDALFYMCDKNLALTTEEEYPLTLTDDKCLMRPTRGVWLDSFVNSCDMYKNETNLLLTLNESPVMVMVNADYLLNYVEGIITAHCETTEDQLNHAVQLVGYDTTGDTRHYILKNSWGPEWGEGGYARIAVGGNHCGIAYSVAYLRVRKD